MRGGFKLLPNLFPCSIKGFANYAFAGNTLVSEIAAFFVNTIIFRDLQKY